MADSDAGEDAAEDTTPDEAGNDGADDAGTTKTFTIDTDTPVTDIAENGTYGAGGTTPSWWTWVRRRRRPVLVVVGLVVVALVATLVIVSILTPGPKDVVQDYLDAIRAGDTDAALAIAGEPDDDERLEFLSAEALADDWTVDAVVERHRRDDETDIDVTISAGDVSQQGRFHMVHGDDGWTMESPFVRVDLAAGNLTTVELGSEQRIKENAAAPPSGIVQLLVFPGVYELYPRYAKRFTVDPAVLVAVPQESDERSQQVSASYTLTGASERQAERAINARVDECAKEPDIDPTGCPFNAEDAAVVRALDDLNDITWTVVAYPEARLIDGSGELGTVLRTPGTVTLTGSGVPVEPEGAARTTFTLTCEFGLNNLVVALSADGVAAGRGAGDDVYAAQSTRCF